MALASVLLNTPGLTGGAPAPPPSGVQGGITRGLSISDSLWPLRPPRVLRPRQKVDAGRLLFTARPRLQVVGQAIPGARTQFGAASELTLWGLASRRSAVRMAAPAQWRLRGGVRHGLAFALRDVREVMDLVLLGALPAEVLIDELERELRENGNRT